MIIEQFVPQEFCLKCKGCCRFREQNSAWLPCLLDEEVQDLLDKKIPPASITAERKIQPVADPSGEGFLCAFLEAGQNKCKIYSFRPFECQLYPFLLSLRSDKTVLTVDPNCPYINAHLSGPEFKAYMEYLDSLLNSPKMRKLLKENLQVIQAYEEAGNEVKEINL